MKSTLFHNSNLDPNRFLAKRLNTGINMTSNKITNNILTFDVIDRQVLNLIDKFVIVEPASEWPSLKKSLNVDRSVLDNLKITLTQTSPPYTLMKTTALFGGMNIDKIKFEPKVPLGVSRAIWHINDSDSYDPSQTCTTSALAGHVSDRFKHITDGVADTKPILSLDNSLTDNTVQLTGVGNIDGDDEEETFESIDRKFMPIISKGLEELEKSGSLGSIEGNQLALDRLNKIQQNKHK